MRRTCCSQRSCSNFQFPTSTFHLHRTSGFTLAEVLLGGLVLAIAVAAILGAYVGQVTLNEHARNLSLAINDANRVIEQIRQQNASCTNPSIVPPAGATTPTSWDAWMTTGNAGAPKSIQPTPDATERVIVTCQNRDGGTTNADYCSAAQQGTGEWKVGAAATLDPLRVTVAVCWRHRNRTIGECSFGGGVLAPSDANANGVIESPAMLTTLVTCRG